VDISGLKGILRNGKPSPAEYTRALHTTLTGISRHTLDGREDELAAFRQGMLALASHVHEQASATEVDATVGYALDLLRDYNQRLLNFHQIQSNELKSVMRTMTETITYLSESRTRSVHQLQFMERELEQAVQIDDIRLLRSRLITCLDVVREETVRLQDESQQRSQQVRDQMDKAAKMGSPTERFGTMDAVTGLPGRRNAERSLSDALGSDKEHIVAAFVVKRLASINARYGRAVGDEVMLRASNYFAQHLSSASSLYRWNGPALVALMQVNGNAEEVRRNWTKIAGAKQEINMNVERRDVFVLVETVLFFQVLSKKTSMEDVARDLDRFVGAQSDGGEGA
jgi:GGDEF domain-containing protein